MQNIAALAFFSNFLHLVSTQIFLRRLQVVLPVDLTAWTVVLVLQFAFSALLVALLPQLARYESRWFALEKLPRWAISGKMATLSATVVFHDTSVALSVLYFALASAELALLFRLSQTAGGTAIATTNFWVNLGAATGLYIAEKIFFRVVPLSTILFVVALLQPMLLLLWQKLLPNFSNILEQPEKNALPYAALLQAFFAGVVLFGGLLPAERVLRLYLLDTADIIAEITVFSMVGGAVISRLYPKQQSVANPIRVALATLCTLLFIALLAHAHRLSILPREFMIFLLLFPLVCISTGNFLAALQKAVQPRQVFYLVAANLVGSLVSAAGFGYWLIPSSGLEKAVLAFAVLALVGGAVILWLSLAKTRQRFLGGFLFLAFTAAPLWFLWRGGWLSAQLQTMAERVAPGENILAIAETAQDIWLLVAKQIEGRTSHHRLIRTSHSMSGTLYPSRRYMKLMAYLGFLYARGTHAALNIGYGTGLTAQALAELDYQKIDASDITRAIVPLASQIHERERRPDPIRDPRVAYHLGGARHFLKNTTQKYDVITGEPPPPSNSSIAYLYTHEFYRLVREHLAEGGVFTYWLPTHSVADASAARIWETFCSVFLYCDLYAGTESNLIMVGYSDNAKVSLAEKFHRLRRTAMLHDTGFSEPEQIFSLLLKSRVLAEEPVDKSLLLHDDYAYIEEDFPDRKRHFWGLPPIPFTSQKVFVEKLLARRFDFRESLPLQPFWIYSADSAFEPYRALRTLEALVPTGVSQEIALWLLGIDPGITPEQVHTIPTAEKLRRKLAQFLAQRDLKSAAALLATELKHKNDEYLYALKILTDRLQGKDANTVRHEAIAFAQKLPRVSEGFARYAGF
ncbi:MAG: hypothetical protein N2Z22_01115 [Turneriella sp.]|nr:hypothetical protein [Turneriella sp.]